jgi:predicted dehydrogenase
MVSISRRQFMRGTALLAASAAAARLEGKIEASVQNQAPRGSNEQLNVACIGVGGRGASHVNSLASRFNCKVTHICDVDSANVRTVVNTVNTRQGSPPTVVADMRRVFDNRDIDIVTIATPNHWHSLAAIWAMQAGKDVYVEKPVSHNVWEGRRCVEVARATRKVCQTGTQSRSSSGLRDAMKFLHEGRLGKVQIARGLCYKSRTSIGHGIGTIPATCDYNLWCGPAPQERPLSRMRLHYDWHWHWDYGNGDIGNQGIHEMDKARWGLGKNELCRSVLSVGGRYGYVDDGQTANTQVTWFDYGDQQLIFEVRGLRTPGLRSVSVGNIYYCANGYMVVPNYTSATAYDLEGNVIQTFRGGDTHMENFVSAVRSRRHEDLYADILEGHLSSALCHLANISYRLGTPQSFEPRQNVFADSPVAQNTLVLMEEHLADNNVPLNSSKLLVGKKLTVQPTNETIADDEEASRMLTRQYRRGFEVPARS